MAWTYLDGIHAITTWTSPSTATIQVTGPGTSATNQTTPVDVKAVFGVPTPSNQRVMGAKPAPLNAIRTITWATDMPPTVSHTPTSQESLVRKYANAGMFVIPCISCNRASDLGTHWDSVTQWQNRVRGFANNVQGYASVIEVGNEPQPGGDFNPDGTGAYYTRLREASAVLRPMGFEVIAAGVPTGKDEPFFRGLHNNGTTNSMFTAGVIQGAGLHPYYENAGDLSWALNSSNYDPGTPEPGQPGGASLPHMIDWVERRRQQLDAWAGGSNVHLWITEFGWNTQLDPQGDGHYAVEGHGSGEQAAKTENAYNAFRNNAEQLKLRAACAFSFADASWKVRQWDNFCGFRTDNPPTGPNSANPPNPRWKDGILTMLENMQDAANPPLPVPPAVQTLAASSITQTSAQLQGTINPKSQPTTFHFEYEQVDTETPPPPVTRTLTVSLPGNGTGIVNSSPAGIALPGDGSETYPENTVVTLTAAETGGATWVGYSGDQASSNRTMQVTMVADMNIAATFTAAAVGTKRLTLVLDGNGSGAVTSSPAGIDTGSAVFGFDFPTGTVVTLSHTQTTGTSFGGWADPDATGHVTMDADKTVHALFTLTKELLTVAISPGGGGTVTSVDGGINAPSDSTQQYDYGTVVDLNAAANGGFSFNNWTNADGSGHVTMDAPKTVTANFNAVGASSALFGPHSIWNHGVDTTSNATYDQANLNPHPYVTWMINAGYTSAGNVYISDNNAGTAFYIVGTDGKWEQAPGHVGETAVYYYIKHGYPGGAGSNLQTALNDVGGCPLPINWRSDNDPTWSGVGGGGNDGQVAVWDKARDILYNFWRLWWWTADPPPEGGARSTRGNMPVYPATTDPPVCWTGGVQKKVSTWRGYNLDGDFKLSGGAILSGNTHNWNAVACGFPNIAGCIRFSELAGALATDASSGGTDGDFGHALSFDIPNYRRAYQWPAQRDDGKIEGSTAPPPGGTWFVIDRTFNCDTLSTPHLRCTARTIQKYGMILRDKNQSGVGFYMESGYSSNHNADTAWNGDRRTPISGLPWSRMKVLTSGAVTNGDSGTQASYPGNPPGIVTAYTP